MTASTDSNIAARVARGVALLDEKAPSWAGRIDLDSLDIMNPCRCVLGQVYGQDFVDPFAAGMDALGISRETQAVTLGFDGSNTDYPALLAEWRRVITERRAS